MPLIKSPSKKALKHNIEVEMESHPSKKKHNQNLAISFAIQRNAKCKKYANGGQVGLEASKKELYAHDQQKQYPKKNHKLGDEFEGDNNPEQPTAKADNYRPKKQYYLNKDWADGPGETPEYDSEDAPKKPDYDADNAVGNKRNKYADGGTVGTKEDDDSYPNMNKIKEQTTAQLKILHPEDEQQDMMEKKRMAYGGKAVRNDGNPGTPAKKPDNTRLNDDDYESNEWAGGKDPMRKPDNERRPKSEYMAGDMEGYADGGEIACMHCGGMNTYNHGGEAEMFDDLGDDHIDADHDGKASIVEAILAKRKMADGGKVELDDEKDPFDHGEGISDYQEEGPGTRRKYNMNTRDYNAGDDRQLSKQPMNSNEHADSREKDSENMNDEDLVDQIRRKLKAKRG